MTIRRLLAISAAVAITGLSAAACGSGSGDAKAVAAPGDLGKVTLHVGDQKGGSQALLAAAGELGNLPYKITWSQFTSGPPELEAANAGAIDVGAVGNTPPIFAAAAGSKITVVAASDGSPAGQAVLLPKGSAIRQLQDLKGKRIALAKGSSAHALFLGVLRKAGLTIGDVQPQYLQPADALAAFSAGRVDAWIIWDPFAAQAEAKLGATRLADDTGLATNYSFQVASHAALRDSGKVAALKDFVARYRRAVLWSNGHQDAWAATWSKEVGLPLSVAKVSVARRVTRSVPLDASVIDAQQQLADAFADAKVIPTKIKFSDFVDARFNEGT